MIVVTGSNGFIGKHLIEKLSLDGHQVYHVDTDNCFEFLNHMDSNIEMIYHMGAISDTRQTDVDLFYRYNIQYSINLFENCAKFGIPIRYASSASVYGNSNNINPLNFYSLSKITVDYWVENNIDRFKLIQGFRFFNVYGNGEDHKEDQASPITKFRKQAESNKIIRIFKGSEFFSRDFICVEDVCEIVTKNEKKSGIYDLGTSNPITFSTVADLIQFYYGGKIETIPMPVDLEKQYQTYTRAKPIWDYDFKTVRQWLNDNCLISSTR